MAGHMSSKLSANEASPVQALANQHAAEANDSSNLSKFEVLELRFHFYFQRTMLVFFALGALSLLASHVWPPQAVSENFPAMGDTSLSGDVLSVHVAQQELSVRRSLEEASSQEGDDIGCTCVAAEEETRIPRDRVRNHVFKPHGAGLKLFFVEHVKRLEAQKFELMGQSSPHAQHHFGQPVDYCTWQSMKSESKEVLGAAVTNASMNEKHHVAYEKVRVECTFNETVGDDNAGGLLFVGKWKSEEDLLVYKELEGGFKKFAKKN